MPSRRQPSPPFEMANCFQSLQCLSGHPPAECSSNSKLICPVLPLSNNQNNNSNNISFSPPNSHGILTSSSDSEEDCPFPNSHHPQQRQHHNTTAKTPIAFPSNQPTTTSPPSTSSTSPTTATTPRPPLRPHRRIPHTLIERRYRDNLNTSIETLRLCLPTLKDAYITTSPDVEDSALPPRLPSKAMIIATAATYIKELESERQAALDETQGLRNQVVELQKLVQCNDCGILRYLQEVGGNGGDGGDGGMTGV